MRIETPSGPIVTNSSDKLVGLLTEAGHDGCATFYLTHLASYPWLSVHLNGQFAYLHYLKSSDHAGFQAQNMTPISCPETVTFHHAPGDEGDQVSMPRSCLVHRDAAVQAASEFFMSLEKPASIDWLEL